MKTNVYPCKPQFYYIKVGFKGVKIIWVCFRDVSALLTFKARSKLLVDDSLKLFCFFFFFFFLDIFMWLVC